MAERRPSEAAGGDPIVANAKHVRVLTGLSGASIYLLTLDGQHWFVRKAAKAPGDSRRLRLQIAKQQQFAKLAAGQAALGVRVPAVRAEGEHAGRYFVDMEFVRGTDGASYLAQADLAQVNALTTRLIHLFELAAQSGPLLAPAPAPLQPASGPAMATLMASLEAKCHEVASKAAVPLPVLTALLAALAELGHAAPRQATMCHGDFTLENLIIDEAGQLCALDWLDAPFEHWWFDMAKLHQDLAGAWYLRKHMRISAGVTSHVSRRLLAASDRLDPNYRAAHFLMLTMTFLRILPYCQTSHDRDLVVERLHHFSAKLVTSLEA